jgi:hypothetical protein
MTHVWVMTLEHVLLLQESGVVYLVRLNNGQRVRAHIFVVYDGPQAIQHAAKPGEDCFQWTCVQRSACKKGCDGPILRAIQRYGRLGRWGTDTRSLKTTCDRSSLGIYPSKARRMLS